jgi:HEPN domain-containing protein
MMATGIFHCQQSAEKALKAFLILNDIEPEKTHNVRVLAQQAGAINSIFNSRLEQARYLNQYNRSFRYPEFPEDQLEPSQGQFNQAFRNAL